VDPESTYSPAFSLKARHIVKFTSELKGLLMCAGDIGSVYLLSKLVSDDKFETSILMGVGICITRLSTSRTSYLFHSSLCLNRNESKFKVLSSLFVSTHQLLFLLLVSRQGHVDDE
jgi:hypothetical protein